MHQINKGNEWHVGMKLHVGVEAGSGHITDMVAGFANEHDVSRAAELIRPNDEVFYGDAASMGSEKGPEIQGDEYKRTIDYRINQRPGQVYRKAENNGQCWERVIERQKSSVRWNSCFASSKYSVAIRRPFSVTARKT